MPDVPLPSVKYLFRQQNRKVDEACQTMESSFEGFTPASTPRMLEGTFSEDEVLRFEMSSPESAVLPRDPDFGYEVIESENENQLTPKVVSKSAATTLTTTVDDGDANSAVLIGEQYKGTPPMRKKKKIPRTSSESQEQVGISFDCVTIWSSIRNFTHRNHHQGQKKHNETLLLLRPIPPWPLMIRYLSILM